MVASGSKWQRTAKKDFSKPSLAPTTCRWRLWVRAVKWSKVTQKWQFSNLKPREESFGSGFWLFSLLGVYVLSWLVLIISVENAIKYMLRTLTTNRVPLLAFSSSSSFLQGRGYHLLLLLIWGLILIFPVLCSRDPALIGQTCGCPGMWQCF